MALGILFFIGYFLVIFLQKQFDFIWFRQFLVYRKLSAPRKLILESYPFYNFLNDRYKKEFEHRVATFIYNKDYKNRYGGRVTDEAYVLIAAVSCRLSFGRRNYLFPLLDTILIFPEPFTSAVNENLHKGEYNPAAKVLALSWEDFKEGMDITNDNLHLGLHEFTHVMHFESSRSGDVDAHRFKKYYNKILKELMNPETRKQLDENQFFRPYAFTNQFELMAVIVEYFFESNAAFQQEFPRIYDHLNKILLYKEEWIME